MRPTWWARNWRWLALLPVALVLMMLASSYRIQPLWFERGFHTEVASGSLGEWVEVSAPGVDVNGEFTRDYSVRLSDVQTVPFEEDPYGYSLLTKEPEGFRTVELRLGFRADPDTPFTGCYLLLVAEDGTTYGGGPQHDPLQQGDGCTPADRPGPLPSLVEGEDPVAVPPEQRRPTEWWLSRRFVVPQDEELTTLRIGFAHPEYVSLHLDR